VHELEEVMRRPRHPAIRWFVLILPAALSVALLPAQTRAEAPSAGDVDFRRDILPILSDKCFQCHGPDAASRKAKLRLDVKDGVFRTEDPLIVPGKSEESELYLRLVSKDETEVMPPPKANRELNAGQIEKVRRWIDQGAKWSDLWSFTPPRRPQPPHSAGGDTWSRNAIDRFVVARLEREGLTPAPEARKETLRRRVTLDLTG
jgi:hypothetical protein